LQEQKAFVPLRESLRQEHQVAVAVAAAAAVTVEVAAQVAEVVGM